MFLSLLCSLCGEGGEMWKFCGVAVLCFGLVIAVEENLVGCKWKFVENLK
jgi:hypothetical protein